jgi:hypothetical protein
LSYLLHRESAIPRDGTPYEGRDMVRNRLAFLAAASLLCGTSTKAREAVLTNFLTTSVRDYNTNFAIAPLTNDLLHYLESIAASTFEPNSITDASPATPIWGLGIH